MDICAVRKCKDPQELAAIRCDVNGISIKRFNCILLVDTGEILVSAHFFYSCWNNHCYLYQRIVNHTYKGKSQASHVVLIQESCYQFLDGTNTA